jgi:hypothetical protein
MGYGRTRPSTADVLRARAAVRYAGKGPTCSAVVGLPVPPGLTAGAGEFAEPVGARRVQKPGVTARQVTLSLGDVRPDSAQGFEYTLRPEYPVKAKAPAHIGRSREVAAGPGIGPLKGAGREGA